MGTDGKMRRRSAVRLPQDRRVSDILAAAREMVLAKGYEGVTMADIAERADIVEGTVYRYFANKDDLLLRVAEIWFTESFSDLVDVSAFGGTYNKLRYLIWHSIKTIAAGPTFTRYVMLEVRPRENYKSTRLFEINRQYTIQIRKLFAEAIESGEFKHGVSERVLRDMVFGTIEHSTWRFLRGEGDVDVNELADEIAAVVYRGMTAQPLGDERMTSVMSRLEAVADRMEQAQKPG
jgi:TetR/AcrR family transcriptional regulator, fatty acid metabolism regulator protein